jgi:hypothetical protein
MPAGKFPPELTPAVSDHLTDGDALEAFIIEELKEDDVVLEGIDAEDEVIADIADAKGQTAGWSMLATGLTRTLISPAVI